VIYHLPKSQRLRFKVFENIALTSPCCWLSTSSSRSLSSSSCHLTVFSRSSAVPPDAPLLPSPRGGNCSPPRASPPRSRSTRNGEGVAWGRVGMQAAWRLAPARRSRRVARRSGAAQTAEALPLAARGRFCPRRAWGYQRHGD